MCIKVVLFEKEAIIYCTKMGKSGSHKFIDPKTARHFSLVHRSVEDPLAFENERGSANVLKEYKRRNTKKKSRNHRGDVENDDIGQAALYGVYLNDAEYDYTKHLKSIGDTPGGVFIEAASGDKDNEDGGSRIKNKKGGDLQFKDTESTTTTTTTANTPDNGNDGDKKKPKKSVTFDLPDSVFASSYKMDVNKEAVPTGLQPFMDPDVREVLEALEDVHITKDIKTAAVSNGEDADGEEFKIDDGDGSELDDDFLAQLNGSDEDFQDESGDDDEENWGLSYNEDGEVDTEDLFAHIQKLKAKGKLHSRYEGDEGSEDDFSDERDYGDYRGGARSAKSGRSRFGGGARSNFSMSSAAMFRNEKLELLDDQFDKIEQEYTRDSDDSDDDSDEDSDGDYRYNDDGEKEYEDSSGRKMTEYRPDLEAMLDDFLGQYEMKGPKLVTKLEGDTGAEKLHTLRNALLTEDSVQKSHKVLLKTASDLEKGKKKKDNVTSIDYIDMDKEQQKKYRDWDCQTILTSYTTLENHPTLIKDANQIQKIRLSKKSGFPIRWEEPEKDGNSDDDDDDDEVKENKGKARSKNESKEEKKARKAAVKEEKKKRRDEKKSTREQFAIKSERKKQSEQSRSQLTVHLD
ncbi:Protein ltv1 [Mycoemilia scoparia]|uniref:Protein ltv1 n=1 Tax=Mycoemilia scoparia TaxID=417184 RepID=A0A9W8DLS5_9FUNG|nr:Protein ltv1 [Mycoemilia scoparia]